MKFKKLDGVKLSMKITGGVEGLKERKNVCKFIIPYVYSGLGLHTLRPNIGPLDYIIVGP